MKLKVKLNMVGNFTNLEQAEQMFAALKEMSRASKFNLDIQKTES